MTSLAPGTSPDYVPPEMPSNPRFDYMMGPLAPPQGGPQLSPQANMGRNSITSALMGIRNPPGGLPGGGLPMPGDPGQMPGGGMGGGMPAPQMGGGRMSPVGGNMGNPFAQIAGQPGNPFPAMRGMPPQQPQSFGPPSRQFDPNLVQPWRGGAPSGPGVL